MAGTQKHKSKYKEPNDFKKSQKQKVRTDLKDYTQEDKDGGMNPNSVGEPQTNVLRKRDKLVIDDVDNMVPNKKDVADYYKVEGDHDPKYTAKKRKEIQNEDEKDSKDQIEDKIENLTREQKERFVRKYIRRKIKNILSEQKALKELDEEENEEAEDETIPMTPGEETPPGGGEETPPGEGEETPPGGGEETPPGGGEETPPGEGEDPGEEEDHEKVTKKIDDEEEESDEEEEDDTVDDVVSDERKEIKRYLKLALKLRKAKNSIKAVEILKPILKLGIKHFDGESKNDFWVILEKYVKPKSLNPDPEDTESSISLPTDPNLRN